MTFTPGVDKAIRRVPSVLPLLTTIISARQPVRETSAVIAARHDLIRTASLYAGTTKLTNTSDILSPQIQVPTSVAENTSGVIHAWSSSGCHPGSGNSSRTG